jgi:hypothetical protein
MTYKISLDTLVMTKRTLEELTEWYLERAVKDLQEFDRTADMRHRSYKAISQLDLATYKLLLTKLEVTDGATD